MYNYFLLQVGFRRPTHANNNLIAIIPTDSESDSQTNNSVSKINNSKQVLISDGTKSTTDVQHLNNEGN